VPCIRRLVRWSLGARVMKVSTRFGSVFPVSLLTSSTASFSKAVPFDEQVALAQSGFPPTNSYYPIPAHSPPWVHPSPPSDTTPPSSNSPTSTLANYAGALPSPSPTMESLGNHHVIDARAQDVCEETSESAAQSPPVTTRNPQGTGRRPGACSRCKKLKVWNVSYLCRRAAENMISSNLADALFLWARPAHLHQVCRRFTPLCCRGTEGEDSGVSLSNYHFIGQFGLISLATGTQST
jgi:hypothetical protein